MLVPNRHASSNSYRYGFQGQEKDDEIKGEGNSYDFGARMYDSRIGRWFKMDPLFMKYAYDSPYIFAGNSTLSIIDPDGERKRKITHTVVMSDDGKTVQSITSENKVISYDLIQKKWYTTDFAGQPVVHYDYYDSVDVVYVVKNSNNETLSSITIIKDKQTSLRYKDTYVPEFILQTEDQIDKVGLGGFIFSDGKGNQSNVEILRKGDKNATWLDGKGLGAVLLTLLGHDIKTAGSGSVIHTTKGETTTLIDKINSFVSSVDNAASATKTTKEEIDKAKIRYEDTLQVHNDEKTNIKFVKREYKNGRLINSDTTKIDDKKKIRK